MKLFDYLALKRKGIAIALFLWVSSKVGERKWKKPKKFALFLQGGGGGGAGWNLRTFQNFKYFSSFFVGKSNK